MGVIGVCASLESLKLLGSFAIGSLTLCAKDWSAVATISDEASAAADRMD